MNSLAAATASPCRRNSKIAIAADQFLGLDERPIDYAELAIRYPDLCTAISNRQQATHVEHAAGLDLASASFPIASISAGVGLCSDWGEVTIDMKRIGRLPLRRAAAVIARRTGSLCETTNGTPPDRQASGIISWAACEAGRRQIAQGMPAQ
jgi:hypothetical protein